MTSAFQYCRACGNRTHESALSCPSCGAVSNLRTGAAGLRSAHGTLWLPVPALITGLVSFLTLFDDSEWDTQTYLGVFTVGLAGLVLGSYGASSQALGRGMSIAGIVLAVLGLLGLVGHALT